VTQDPESGRTLGPLADDLATAGRRARPPVRRRRVDSLTLGRASA
jgi:hypothetical protein